MGKIINTIGYFGLSALTLSVVFKLLHWTGARKLLLIGSISTLLFIVLRTAEKIRNHT